VELNRKAKGDLAELKVAADLRARGYKVAFPFGEDWDFDLILCRDDGILERVQVKYARSDGRVISVSARSHSLTNGKIRTTKHYTSHIIDWLAVWDATGDRCYYVRAQELGAGMTELTLRLAPAANRQVRRIRMAAQYADI
jgi:Holliday junction resolvase-like predicted endonuclease